MEWETPSFVEIDMSAEIGSYQDEHDPTPWPAFVERQPARPNDDA